MQLLCNQEQSGFWIQDTRYKIYKIGRFVTCGCWLFVMFFISIKIQLLCNQEKSGFLDFGCEIQNIQNCNGCNVQQVLGLVQIEQNFSFKKQQKREVREDTVIEIGQISFCLMFQTLLIKISHIMKLRSPASDGQGQVVELYQLSILACYGNCVRVQQ
eukprot:TRINITY_DN1065_c0_g1_i11.p5 TRINITY_DN1065_c0_g1~~TRINITY_DN1065_c0_g1_i11.p5  ORF type:complete len:158 (-),score=3.24 TRINITY_DN1065_c0_g1_i11:200-673(-)